MYATGPTHVVNFYRNTHTHTRGQFLNRLEDGSAEMASCFFRNGTRSPDVAFNFDLLNQSMTANPISSAGPTAQRARQIGGRSSIG